VFAGILHAETSRSGPRGARATIGACPVKVA